MNTEPQACAATPHETLIGRILDSRIPKNEEGWAAAREIEQLRSTSATLEAVNELCEREGMALAEENRKLRAAQANMIDATGAVESEVLTAALNNWTRVNVKVPDDWAGSRVLIVRVP